MAHSGVQKDHLCKDCGVYFDTIKSLDVHLQYHKENLLIKWATQPDETNNNNASSNKHRSSVTTAPADSSDGMMKTEPGRPSGSGSPQPNSFNHPPTPSSYSSAPSPFQDSSAQRFSPMASVGYSLSDRTPPHQQNGVLHPFSQQYSNFMTPSSDGSGYFMDGSSNSGYILGSGTDFPASSNVDNLRSSPNSVSSPSSSSSIGPVITSTGMYRYHPYHQPQSSGSQLYVPDHNNGVTSSGPSPSSSYQPPPTPHQCDKCGFVCNSSSALLEHLNNAHPPAPSPPYMNNQMRFQQEAMFQNYHGNNESRDTAMGGQQAAAAAAGKMKDEPAAEILDLDSHKVHQVYQPEEEATALRAAASSEASNRGGHPHSVSAMLWGSTPQTNANPHAMSSTTQQEFRGVTSPGGVTVPHQQPMTYQKAGVYSQHLAPIPGQVIHPHLHHMTSVPNISSSSLPPPGPMPSTSPHQQKNGPSMQQTSQQPGNQTWKSNEARRPKTYNCSACNKWFTSSGHLKRHYNTTLHKNAVKQSGAPDPATQPITNHHHPGRASTDVATSARGTPAGESHVTQQSPAGLGPQLPSVVEDTSRSDDASSNGNYRRHTPSVQQGNLLPTGNQQQASPPNLMAGPSIIMEAQMGGLHFLTSSYSSESLLHDPSNSVRTSPAPAPQMPPEAVLHQLGAPQPLSSQHPYMLGQVVSPPLSQPQPSLPLTHHLIHHPIPQHQPLHPSQHPTPPPSLQVTNLTEMYSPNGQPPHISILQEHQPMLPTSINNHLIPITGNCGSSGGTVSPLNLQDDQQFLFPVTSSPQQDKQPLPSFAQIGHHPFGASSLVGFSELTAVTSSPNYSMVSTEPITTMTDNVGGLLNSDHQHLLATMKQSDVYKNNNNLYWFNNFEDQNSLLDESSSKALLADSTGNRSNGNVSLNLSPTTPDCHTSNINFDKPLQTVTHTTNARCEDDITSTGMEEITAMVANNNNNINTTTNNNRINKAKNSIFKSMSISSGSLHKCVDCDKVFNKACYLTQHNKSFHSGHKPYKCDRCGKRFMIEITYEQHLAKHAGEKPYKCDVCPKQFNHKTDLRRHMCLHTGMKPFQCNICSKGFIRKDHMLKHCETHRRKAAHPHNGIQVVSAK